MFKTLYQAIASNLILAVIVCGIYPLAVTVIGQTLFHSQANGSLITDSSGKVVGSHLIGQVFDRPEYFHGRPSAAGTGYDAANSSASNLGPTNQKFADAVKGNIDAVLKENPTLQKGSIPTDIVTASGSGLDPHISPDAARIQVSRVAQARHLEPSRVTALVEAHVRGPELGLLGEAVVNVLELNLSLDELSKLK